MNKRKQDFLKKIKSNIDSFGYHLTLVVEGSQLPRYGYTIGLTEKKGCELIFAGGEYYDYKQIETIISNLISAIDSKKINDIALNINSLGTFSFRKVHPSWSKKMMLGVYDYYSINDSEAYQIIPDSAHFTLDIPDMSVEWIPEELPIWKWLDGDVIWNLDIPEDSMIITDIDSLFGKKITEVMRWEENEWEAFTQNGEEIPEEKIRIVPINVLLGIDNTLKPILKLDIGKGFLRDEDMEWNNWG